jgi:predicted nucleic acid-binding protein
MTKSNTVLVDSNILLDIFTQDESWYSWSAEALARTANSSTLAINPIIYSEVSVRFDSLEELDEVLSEETLARLPLPWPAAFLAGRCFVMYRRRGGLRRSPLPDFYVGAHAAVDGMQLLTRDPSRYRTYLPQLSLIAP